MTDEVKNPEPDADEVAGHVERAKARVRSRYTPAEAFRIATSIAGAVQEAVATLGSLRDVGPEETIDDLTDEQKLAFGRAYAIGYFSKVGLHQAHENPTGFALSLDGEIVGAEIQPTDVGGLLDALTEAGIVRATTGFNIKVEPIYSTPNAWAEQERARVEALDAASAGQIN